jgi:hypothetical protein
MLPSGGGVRVREGERLNRLDADALVHGVLVHDHELLQLRRLLLPTDVATTAAAAAAAGRGGGVTATGATAGCDATSDGDAREDELAVQLANDAQPGQHGARDAQAAQGRHVRR